MKIKRMIVKSEKHTHRVPEKMMEHSIKKIIAAADYTLSGKGDRSDFKIIIEVERGAR